MFAIKVKSSRVKGLIFLMILLASTGVVGSYAILQSETVFLEVKEPLEILVYKSSLHLYPGETLQFSVAVKNHASVSYNASLSFNSNDTAYQEKYVTFSNTIYLIAPGTQLLDAWLKVSEVAPTVELELKISINRNQDLPPQISPPPSSDLSSLTPSALLLGAGARWAAGNGTKALYVNWHDNYIVHGEQWGPYWREGQISEIKNKTVEILQLQGFTVTCVGDVPNDLSSYDLVVFEAWFAVEPKHTQAVREYLDSGGNVVIIGGVPCYFATYCKDLWPYASGLSGGSNLASLQDWFGSAHFVNSGGTANMVMDQPFGTLLEAQSKIYHINAYGCYALTSMSDDAQIIARWSEDQCMLSLTNTVTEKYSTKQR